jgi:hypothetical protein
MEFKNGLFFCLSLFFNFFQSLKIKVRAAENLISSGLKSNFSRSKLGFSRWKFSLSR